MKNKNLFLIPIVIAGIIVLNIAASFLFFRWDLTADKRYTVSANTQKLMSGLDKKMQIKIYLDGDLNPNFLRLKKSTGELLDEFKAYTSADLTYEYVNPSVAETDDERKAKQEALFQKGLIPTDVQSKDEEGKITIQQIFPWAEINYNDKTFYVQLYKENPDTRISEEQNINNSIENLEFEFTDAIRVNTMKSFAKVAFIEGHGEYPEDFVHDASNAFNRYFEVFWGQLEDNPSALKDFKAIVIANPQTPFTEKEKFIIDQYIMRGGRVLWLLNGVRLAQDSLSTVGVSPAIPLDVNLKDQLFKYGVRIAPVILQDMQCVKMPINVARQGEPAKFEGMPYYYSPLLLTSPVHPITRNIQEVKANFASALELGVSSNPDVKKDVLLVTSNATHAEMTPARIDLRTMWDKDSKTYFDMYNIPVAVALEGSFESVFKNRMPPLNYPQRNKSEPTRMVVVANADIIRNDVHVSGNDTIRLPMGYDRYSKRIYGNRSFILNSMLYLADDEGWLQLRSRDFALRMLNKREVIAHKKRWQAINVALPIALLLAFAGGYWYVRKRKYT